MLETILNTTGPVFLLISAGYLAVRLNFVVQEGVVSIGRYVLYFALPAMIYTSLNTLNFSEVFNLSFFAAYGIGSLLAMALGFCVAHYAFKQSFTFSGVKALGSSLSNSVFFGYPVMLQLFGDAPAAAFATALIAENLILFPIALTLIEYGYNRRTGEVRLKDIWLKVFTRIIKNPLVIAIAASVIASIVQLQLPEIVDKTFNMLALSSAPVALFAIGGSLVGSTLKGKVTDLSSVIIGKLVFHPLLVLMMVWLLPGFDPKLQLAAVVLAAMPMMSVYPIVGGGYGFRQECASILLGATCAAFVTISIILILLQ